MRLTLDTAQLDRLRAEGDPLADAVIGPLLRQGYSRGNTMEFLREGAEKGETVFQDFLESLTPPIWLNRTRIELGQEVCVRHSPASLIVLLLGSFIENFASPHIASLLSHTGRLHHDTTIRVYETAVMVRDVWVKGGLKEDGVGIESALRVRLLHAMVRHHVMRSGRWDETKDGSPINQEDMALTLLHFSHVVLNGLKQIGVSLSPNEQDAYQHLWRYVGHLMGVYDELMPDTREEAAQLYALLRERHYHPSEDSRSLTEAMMHDLSWKPPLFLPQNLMEAISRSLVGDPLADQMGLPNSQFWGRICRSLWFIYKCLDAIEHILPKGKQLGFFLGNGFMEFSYRFIVSPKTPEQFNYRTQSKPDSFT